MTQSAKDLKRTAKRILIYGPTGSGKTTLLTTIPGKIFAYMFDPGGIDTIAGQDIDYEYFPRDPQLGIVSPIPKAGQTAKRDDRAPKRAEPMAYADFEDHLEAWLTNPDFPAPYDCIALDSLTMLGVICMDRILHIQGKYGQIAELSDYNVLGQSLMKLLSSVSGRLPPDKMLFITGHSDLTQEEVSKKIINQFDITKGVRRELPRLMTDVWVSTGEIDQTKHIFKLQTGPDRYWPTARNSFGLPPFVDVTLDFRKPRIEQGVGRFLAEQRR